ncbi:hypothetical protein LCGC14_0244360 [marine sediment metagenome]|uniref:Uncharacterized protein n=1 Tax=marine sediment metagenome TaxID=412755 RepID=A0A0F9UB32_9ZZZZ
MPRGENWKRRRSSLPKDVVGNVYGTLTVLHEVFPTIKNGRQVATICECGVEKIVYLGNCVSGVTKSCGANMHRQKHGYSPVGGKNPMYSLWCSIKERCGGKSRKYHAYYSARGIKMYEPWIDDAGAFIRWLEENLGPRPEEHSLDRINNDGNYEPGNLRWATHRQQTLNRRTTLNRDLPPGIYRQKATTKPLSHKGKKRVAGLEDQYRVVLSLGTFTSLEEAEKILEEAKTSLGTLVEW